MSRQARQRARGSASEASDEAAADRLSDRAAHRRTSAELNKPKPKTRLAPNRHADKRLLNGAVAALFAAQAWLFAASAHADASDQRVALTRSVTHFERNAATLRVEQRTESHTLVALSVDSTAAAYFAIATLHHAAVLLPGVFEHYTRALDRGVAPHRWLLYAVSASIMMIVLNLAVGQVCLYLCVDGAGGGRGGVDGLEMDRRRRCHLTE